MVGYGHPAQQRFVERRKAWLQALLHEAAYSGEPVRVGWADQTGKPGHRRDVGAGDIHYDLRCVLPTQAVFDLGDHTPWERTVRDTHLVWDQLNEWAVPYLGALTGGKGTHTEVFLRPRGADRTWFVAAVLAAINDRLGVQAELRGEGVTCDPVTVAPAPQSRLLREFGAIKKNNRKVLWTQGPGPYRPIPLDRDEAYRQASGLVPTSFEVATHPPGARHRAVAEMLGKACPREPGCFNVNETDLDGWCSACPTSM